MQPFRILLEHPVYWTLNRHNVTRAFALGLFIAFVPLPIQSLLAIVLALWLRLNIPAVVAGTLLTNPFMMVPLFLFAYWVGTRILGVPEHPVAFEMSWHWLTSGLLPIWKPFLLGCAVMGALSALTGYLLLAGLWHVTLVMRYHKRKNSGVEKSSQNAPK